MFYVSHAPGSVRKMCDRVIVLENGKVGFDGEVDAGIHHLKYDAQDPDEEDAEDEQLGADI
jgi:ABC-2 type transport system ATP-binding protein